MNHNLKLDIYFNGGNQGMLTLKHGHLFNRLNRLCNGLAFVANMKQLSMAIDTGANQNCLYRLKNTKGLEWVLSCKFIKEVVSLEVWKTDFSWQGTAIEFGKAVSRMIERMPKYRFILF